MAIFIPGSDGRTLRKLDGLWDENSHTVTGRLELVLKLVDRCLDDVRSACLSSDPQIEHSFEAGVTALADALTRLKSSYATEGLDEGSFIED